MFGGGGNNPYDDIVVKTTDENLTSENWELILNLCDKVNDEGQEGARNVIAAVLKRLAHRNPNVQLYALTLAEALSKNCRIELHREIASRAFTQGLEKLITDRNSHDKVKRRVLGLIAQWTSEFENDSTLGVMEDCYNGLKSKNYKFEAPEEAPPPTVDDEIRRKEEEELQRVLEMSMQDKGGRGHWQQYSLAASDAPGASASGSSAKKQASSNSRPVTGNTTSASKAYNQPLYQSGYVPARTPSPRPQSPVQQTQIDPAPAPTASTTSVASATSTTTSTVSANSSSAAASINIITRVRALHTFEPTEPGELAFEKGDIIKVVDRGYQDWWRGQLKGRTGIFPVNYVEPMPEPTAAELAKEAEQEAAVFAQAVNVEKLLLMLRSLDPAKDNLADNEEIQELYRSSMALRPKIVKLIDKYSQKRADLVSMNETFLRARSIFDRMMEESLARHTGVYDAPYRPAQYPHPESRNLDYAPTPAPQTFGWNPAVYDQPGYNAYPAPAAAYGPGPGPITEAGMYPPGPQLPHAQSGSAPYGDANTYNQQGPGQQLHQHQPHPSTAGYPQPYLNHQQSYGPQGPTPYPAQQPPPQQSQPQQQPPQQVSPQQQTFQQTPLQVQPAQPPILTGTQGPAQSYPGPQDSQSTPVTSLGPAQSLSVSQDSTPSAQAIPHNQVQGFQEPARTHTQPSQMVDPLPQTQQGPPYVFDPNTTYADPNVQAWAQYYSHGGTDLAGAVYFVSVPGITDKKVAIPSATPEAASASAGSNTSQSAEPQAVQNVQPQIEPAPTQSPARASSFPDPYASLAPSMAPTQAGNPIDQPGHTLSQLQTQSLPQTTANQGLPTWVLPRHPSAAVSASPPQSPAQAQPDHRNSFHDPQGQFYGAPAQQFSGLSLSDNSSVTKPQVGI